MVEGRTARRSHSRKNGHAVSPLRRRPKASGLTERIRSPCWKCRDARRGGLNWTASHWRKAACPVMAARKAWTAAVCSRLDFAQFKRRKRGNRQAGGTE